MNPKHLEEVTTVCPVLHEVPGKSGGGGGGQVAGDGDKNMLDARALGRDPAALLKENGWRPSKRIEVNPFLTPTKQNSKG